MLFGANAVLAPDSQAKGPLTCPCGRDPRARAACVICQLLLNLRVHTLPMPKALSGVLLTGKPASAANMADDAPKQPLWVAVRQHALEVQNVYPQVE
jgi:hypothetical protein